MLKTKEKEAEGSVSSASSHPSRINRRANIVYSHSTLALKNEILEAPETSQQEERGEFTGSRL